MHLRDVPTFPARLSWHSKGGHVVLVEGRWARRVDVVEVLSKRVARVPATSPPILGKRLTGQPVVGNSPGLGPERVRSPAFGKGQ